MPEAWAVDFVVELRGTLDADTLLEVIRLRDPVYAHQQRVREQEQQLAEAQERSRALLMDFLDDEQRATLEREGGFYVTSSEGNRFRLVVARSHNTVARVDGNGTILNSYCIYVPGVPEADQAITLAVLLQTNEAEFRRVVGYQWR